MADPIWLPEILRKAGLKVVEEPGWKYRGRGDFGEIKGVMLHHTAGAKTGNTPSLDVVTHGRKGLAGPLSQLVLGRDGTFFVVAAGRANHAGPGSWKGITNGNRYFIGIEAENTGLKNDSPWPEEQYDAYVKGVAAILEHLDLPTIMAVGHSEYAKPKGRKIDPSFDMDQFRKKVDMARKKKQVVEEVIELKLEEEIKPQAELVEPDVEEIIEAEAREEVVDPTRLASLDKARLAKKMLEELGWKEHQAAAIISQAMVESDMNENKTVYVIDKKVVPPETPDAKLDAYGLMKWRGGRLEHLENYAGADKSDFEMQVRFIDWELRNTEKVASKELKESTEIMSALRAAIGYIRPANWTSEFPENGSGWKERLFAAYDLLRK